MSFVKISTPDIIVDIQMFEPSLAQISDFIEKDLVVSFIKDLKIERQIRTRCMIQNPARYYTYALTYIHTHIMIHPAVFRPTACTFVTPTRCVWYSQVNTTNEQMPVILLIRVARNSRRRRISLARARAGNYALRQFVSLERRLARTWPFHFSSTGAPVLFSTCVPSGRCLDPVARGARFLLGNA